MDEIIRTVAISPLRQRLIDDMNVRRFSRSTQHNYVRDVGRFATFLGRSPDTATPMTCASFRSTSARPACRRRPCEPIRAIATNSSDRTPAGSGRGASRTVRQVGKCRHPLARKREERWSLSAADGLQDALVRFRRQSVRSHGRVVAGFREEP
jgi:hypothetical protein